MKSSKLLWNLGYLIVGALSVALAASIAVHFTRPAFSQDKAPDKPKVPAQEKLGVPPAPPAAPATAAKPAASPVAAAPAGPLSTPVPSTNVSPAPAPAAPTGPTSGTTGGSTKKVNLLEGIVEDFSYDPAGKRDPFQPFTLKPVTTSTAQGPVLPLQRFDIDQLSVVGIIWDVPNPKAMLLDPTGKSHYVSLNDKVGRYNGYIAAIRDGEVVVIEAAELEGKITYQTRVIKLQKDN